MSTPAPSKHAASLRIITAILTPSIRKDLHTTPNTENVQRSTYNPLDCKSPSARGNVGANRLFRRYSFALDLSAPTRSIGSALESGRKERGIESRLDDVEGCPQSMEEEMDIDLHDKDGNVYLEKAVVRSRKDRRPSKSNDGKVVLPGDTPSVHQKHFALLQEEETSELWSPLDISCCGAGRC